MLSIALRTLDSNGTAAGVSWTGDSPPAALALDILTASGGAADPPQGRVLGTRFLIFSRLCWRSAAFSSPWTVYPKLCGQRSRLDRDPSGRRSSRRDCGRDRGEPRSGTNPAPCPHGPKPFTSYPGSPFVPRWATPGGSSCGAPKIPGSLAADEQSVLELIRALGREDPLPALPEAPPHPARYPATATTGVFHALSHSGTFSRGARNRPAILEEALGNGGCRGRCSGPSGVFLIFLPWSRETTPKRRRPRYSQHAGSARPPTRLLHPTGPVPLPVPLPGPAPPSPRRKSSPTRSRQPKSTRQPRPEVKNRHQARAVGFETPTGCVRSYRGRDSAIAPARRAPDVCRQIARGPVRLPAPCRLPLRP